MLLCPISLQPYDFVECEMWATHVVSEEPTCGNKGYIIIVSIPEGKEDSATDHKRLGCAGLSPGALSLQAGAGVFLAFSMCTSYPHF